MISKNKYFEITNSIKFTKFSMRKVLVTKDQCIFFALSRNLGSAAFWFDPTYFSPLLLLSYVAEISAIWLTVLCATIIKSDNISTAGNML
jgi:hypothetical protein